MNEIGFYTNQAKMQFKYNHRKGLKVDSSGLLHCVANDRPLSPSLRALKKGVAIHKQKELESIL